MLLFESLNNAMEIYDGLITTVIDSTDLRKDFSLSPYDEIGVLTDSDDILIYLRMFVDNEDNLKDIDIFALSSTNSYPYLFDADEKENILEKIKEELYVH